MIRLTLLLIFISVFSSCSSFRANPDNTAVLFLVFDRSFEDQRLALYNTIGRDFVTELSSANGVYESRIFRNTALFKVKPGKQTFTLDKRIIWNRCQATLTPKTDQITYLQCSITNPQKTIFLDDLTFSLKEITKSKAKEIATEVHVLRGGRADDIKIP